MLTTNTTGALLSRHKLGGVENSGIIRQGGNAMQETVSVKIVKKCRVHDKHQKPGNVIVVSKSDAKLLLGMGYAEEVKAKAKPESAEGGKAEKK